MNDSVFDHIPTTGINGELKVIADQVGRDVKAGRDLDEVITEAQYTLGLSYAEAKLVEAEVDKEAGLRSTLRKLRRQLEGHNHEDLDGMNKLLTAIKGIEEQLKQKDEKREQRKKKKSESGPSEESEDGADKEAAADVTAADPGDAPLDPAEPPMSPQAPLPTGPEMAERRISFTNALKRLEDRLAQLTTEIESAMGIPAMRTQVQQDEPLLMEWLRTIEGKRLLVQQRGQKFSLLLSEPEKSPKPMMIKQFEARLIEEAKAGEEWATKSLNVLRGFKGQDDLWTNPKPSIKVNPTPKTLEKAPHMQLGPDQAQPAPTPQQQPKTSAYRILAEEGMAAGATNSIKRTLMPALEALDEALQNLTDLMDVAEMQLGLA